METKYEIEVHGYDNRFKLVGDVTLMVPVPGLDLDPRVRAGAVLGAIAYARAKVPGFAGVSAVTAAVVNVETPDYIG